MIQSIVFCIVAVSAIVALFLAWYFYQQARDKERMFLIEKGLKFEDILKSQKEDRFKFVLPWLKLGIVTSSLSIAFLIIAFIIRFLENDEELFKGFLITFIIGFSVSISLFIIHFISKKNKS
jgi:hypothetical protein